MHLSGDCSRLLLPFQGAKDGKAGCLSRGLAAGRVLGRLRDLQILGSADLVWTFERRRSFAGDRIFPFFSRSCLAHLLLALSGCALLV